MALNLIFDRAEEAAIRLKELKAIGSDNWTADEREEWFLTINRGGYNISDYNRVESAVQQLATTLNSLGYATLLQTKTDWAEGYTPAPADLDRYIANIHTLRPILPTLPGTPEAPATMDGIDWQGANDIEKILLDIETVIERMVAAFWYMGELFMGEVME